MESNFKLPEGFSYDELVKALLERFKPYLQEIIREELSILNKDLPIDKPKTRLSIVDTEPQVADNGRYNVAKACQVLGISRKTLYKYCELGLISYGIRKANGRKFFIGSAIKKLWRAQY